MVTIRPIKWNFWIYLIINTRVECLPTFGIEKIVLTINNHARG